MKNDQETWKRYNNRMGNQKIKKMKIVLVGSSPAMLLQALILAKIQDIYKKDLINRNKLFMLPSDL